MVFDLRGFHRGLTLFDSILVVVNRFTNMAHFIPSNKLISGEKTVELFFDHVFHYHGLFEDIVFYCEPQFASKF
jgi:hypothetical protein